MAGQVFLLVKAGDLADARNTTCDAHVESRGKKGEIRCGDAMPFPRPEQ